MRPDTIIKLAQDIYSNLDYYYDPSAAGPRRGIPRKKRLMGEAYPDYGRSLVSQHKGDPATSGLIRGAGYGTLGAVLGALAAKLADRSKGEVATAALAGGLLGGGTGYYSGKREQESMNSKMLFLRRLGIDNPGELEAVEHYPLLAPRLTTKGVKV